MMMTTKEVTRKHKKAGDWLYMNEIDIDIDRERERGWAVKVTGWLQACHLSLFHVIVINCNIWGFMLLFLVFT